MLKQGFEEDIEEIFRAVKTETNSKFQTILFSATFPEWIKQISERYQEKNCTTVDLIGSTELVPETIRHFTYHLRSRYHITQAVRKLCKALASPDGRCIIFCGSKRSAEIYYKELEDEKCALLHGEVKQRDREDIYRDFKSGRLLKIIATDVAARGLDFPKIELVIQTEPPKLVEAYIHRAGRTGRAGQKGICVMLVQRDDTDRIYSIEKEAGFRFEELKDSDLKKSI